MALRYSWELFKYCLNLLLFITEIGLWGIFIYYAVISIFGWFKRKEPAPSQFPLKTKFAVLIAAHNEEAVVPGVINSIKRVHYPKSLYDIFVIADNCTDNTAKVARALGVNVYERFDPVKKGKGFSLEWMFKNLFNLKTKYDAICILDADNLVSANFFAEMNKHLCLGHKVIQGYLDSKNPHDTWVSGNYSIAYWISNRLFQLPRHYLGLNCALGGTGFVMSTEVLRETGWGATCLTEDLEFSMKLVLKGMRVAWAHEAIIYDEKPLRISQSWRQRTRWMQGHSDCAQRFAKKLFLKAFRDRDMVAFDAALYLIQPFLIVINGLGMVIGMIQSGTKMFTHHHMMITGQTWLYIAIMAILTYINIVFVIAEGKLTKKIVGYFLIFPIYSLTWIPIIIQGFMKRNRHDWVHTVHTRAIDITDVERLERVV
jgi:cellulose synthase/poly-beta-1,6-N-acetylglucosamine synthase-like glycosyltransferase